MGSTNYASTFIQVAEDCPVQAAQEPPAGGKSPTVAELQYRLIAERPYELTSDEVLFTVHATRHGISEEERPAVREAFFARDQACLRSSPLGKRYGWGVHHDDQGRIALVALGSDEYRALSADPSVKQLRAMRSKRASRTRRAHSAQLVRGRPRDTRPPVPTLHSAKWTLPWAWRLSRPSSPALAASSPRTDTATRSAQHS